MRTIKSILKLLPSLVILGLLATCMLGYALSDRTTPAKSTTQDASPASSADDAKHVPSTISAVDETNSSSKASTGMPPYTSRADDLTGTGDQGDAISQAQVSLTTACHLKSGNDQQICDFFQYRWVEEYQNALAGDYLAAVNTSYTLRRPEKDYTFANAIQSCAWAYVVIRSGSRYVRDSDVENLKLSCAPLDEIGRTAAEARATALARIIHSHKVHRVSVPEMGYDPKHDGDEAD